MVSSVLSSYAATLGRLQRKARLRTLSPRQGLDFTSNDFLALANAPRLKDAVQSAMKRGVPVGAAGSRLLRGNHPEHETLEEEAAEFFGSERVLYFGSGYAANSALFSTLPQRNDLIVHDALIHASVHEGITGSKAVAVGAGHNDAGSFDDAIQRWRRKGGRGRPWLAVESLYSMDGDRAPLTALADIADRHDGFLVIDEAHATGVLGNDGKGLAADLEGRENVIALHTCGKALGVSGALLAAPGVLADYLVNRARAFIYSTAPSPLMAAGVREALRIVKDEPERRAALQRLVALLGARLESQFGIAPSRSQIQPILIGDNARAVRIAQALQADGFDIRAIRPPTVPEGTARLRLSVTLNADWSEIMAMLDCLAVTMTEHGR
ncbi:8-amino-7-oxononanoate synthase (plasmid) [Rhizobium grahamii]|uniref:8-amino-7-oxononanoate synthase n=1 Tax=Rhizobium grahamii TaxID=1120045 RepID=A0A5Q0CDA5_9HYPH|nr:MULTISPECIES: 8-amino-7-oxononanoate synthase [Rhizobium]QFY63828.1 8-amino-7-oxononanoate synthase [Rhizobium grahamii]QRM52929.1 8-amino-7-oxononanoate synthase [Rhizobium sp. BG6]